MTLRRTFVLSAALACAAALPATAQQTFGPAAGFGPSIEAGLGVSAGAGGRFMGRAGAAADVVLAVPLRQGAGGTVLLAATGTANGPLAGSDVCVIGPDQECLDRYPTFLSLGLAAGVQRRLGPGLSTRMLAGAAFYQSVDGPGAFGLQGRVDVAKPLVLRTALVASARASLLPRFRREPLAFAAVGLGLRVQ